MDGGASPDAPKEIARAFKHARNTAKAIAERRQFALLLRDMQHLFEQVEGQRRADHAPRSFVTTRADFLNH